MKMFSTFSLFAANHRVHEKNNIKSSPHSMHCTKMLNYFVVWQKYR